MVIGCDNYYGEISHAPSMGKMYLRVWPGVYLGVWPVVSH